MVQPYCVCIDGEQYKCDPVVSAEIEAIQDLLFWSKDKEQIARLTSRMYQRLRQSIQDKKAIKITRKAA